MKLIFLRPDHQGSFLTFYPEDLLGFLDLRNLINKSNIVITIVIPVYNGARTIDKLVQKLLAISGSENLQIVLVNDGSNDNSHEVCYDLFLKYPDVVTFS